MESSTAFDLSRYQKELTQPPDTELIKELHRGETAAIESYEKARAHFDEKEVSHGLNQLQLEHRAAHAALEREIEIRRGCPDEFSGLWGLFARTVEGAATVVSDRLALSVLREGEEYGLGLYTYALSKPELEGATRALIKETLIPQQRIHIASLVKLESTVTE